MKVMLLSPPYIPLFMRNARWYTKALSGSFWYPIYLAYCTGLLEREGHETLLIDAEASGITHEETFIKAKEFSPDLLVLYFTITSLENDLEVGEQIHELTGAEVVLVGPSASMNPISVLPKSDKINFLAKGEFDFTILDLANKVDKEKIAGLYWQNEKGDVVENPPRELVSGDQLDKFPFVTDVYRRHLNIDDYYQTAHRHPFVDLFTGRGCAWGLCTFCLWPHTLNREQNNGNVPLGHDKKPGRTNLYRKRSMDNVIEELKFIKQEMPYIKEVFIQDDVLPEERAIELSEAILENGLKLRWSCYSRATLDYETLRLMKRAGCRTMHVGYESGSQKILKNIRKGTRVSKMEQFTKDARKVGLYIVADFMNGLPGETEDTIKETIEFAKRLPVQRYTITPAMPYPETPFYDWLVANDSLKDERPNYPNLSWDEIVQWNKWSYRKVYLNRKFFFRMIFKPIEWYRLIRSAVYAIPYMFR